MMIVIEAGSRAIDLEYWDSGGLWMWWAWSGSHGWRPFVTPPDPRFDDD